MPQDPLIIQLPQDPLIIQLREKFRVEKEKNAKAEEAARVKFYYFGSRGKRSCFPIKLLEINGFIDWIEKYKIDILDKILYVNDIQNLLDEFNNIP